MGQDTLCNLRGPWDELDRPQDRSTLAAGAYVLHVEAGDNFLDEAVQQPRDLRPFARLDGPPDRPQLLDEGFGPRRQRHEQGFDLLLAPLQLCHPVEELL